MYKQTVDKFKKNFDELKKICSLENLHALVYKNNITQTANRLGLSRENTLFFLQSIGVKYIELKLLTMKEITDGIGIKNYSVKLINIRKFNLSPILFIKIHQELLNGTKWILQNQLFLSLYITYFTDSAGNDLTFAILNSDNFTPEKVNKNVEIEVSQLINIENINIDKCMQSTQCILQMLKDADLAQKQIQQAANEFKFYEEAKEQNIIKSFDYDKLSNEISAILVSKISNMDIVQFQACLNEIVYYLKSNHYEKFFEDPKDENRKQKHFYFETLGENLTSIIQNNITNISDFALHSCLDDLLKYFENKLYENSYNKIQELKISSEDKEKYISQLNENIYEIRNNINLTFQSNNNLNIQNLIEDQLDNYINSNQI